MLNTSANFFESAARAMGLSIRIPRPSKRLTHQSILINGLVGSGLIVSGVMFRKLPLVLIGTLGVAGAAILALDD